MKKVQKGQKLPEPHPHIGLYTHAPAERSPHGWPLCVYCGQPADALDHQPPLSRVDDYQKLYLEREQYWQVKACKPCCELLGDDLQKDIFVRIEALKYRLQRTLRRHDAALSWADDDLAELGHSLRSKVSVSAAVVSATQPRIDYQGGLRLLREAARRT
ncbi:hypothetical protein PKB_1779 [Pseudomonas knackmussii B13]|uniref:Uncharacterized protein n=1 Tax=Pseudomonas knackmussii (strain DSM 6978 / CCUG 54928 / LMG 23759 / B13) TaxID=1301098 RepID=A0A024HF74_PSEKB|nr:hypothetical protein [Pseudomonas knackmussii]CDF83137.1 hypothetical protein PKB_1779 [Pseudomonas knackmussii B13]